MSGPPAAFESGGRRAHGPALLLALLVLAAAAFVPPAARADGDPASDFLLEQSTFLSPFDGHIASSAASGLVGMLSAASKRGLSLKVAVIVTAYDLGAVPVLFKRPQTYARFLGEEDYYYWKDELIVVMPNGYGIYLSTTHGDGVTAADQAAIRTLAFHPTSNGTALVVDAQRAVRAVAAKHGITLGVAAAGASKKTLSTADTERFEIAGGVAAALLLAAALRFGRRLRVRAR